MNWSFSSNIAQSTAQDHARLLHGNVTTFTYMMPRMCTNWCRQQYSSLGNATILSDTDSYSDTDSCMM